MRFCALAVILLQPCVAAAQACSAALPGGTELESVRFSLGFRTVPEIIAVGKHFAVEVAVCPKAGAGTPESIGIDAHMPEHRHGMNYRAQLTDLPGGRYRATGLMFHMPGRWEFIFDVRSGEKTDRLTLSTVVR